MPSALTHDHITQSAPKATPALHQHQIHITIQLTTIPNLQEQSQKSSPNSFIAAEPSSLSLPFSPLYHLHKFTTSASTPYLSQIITMAILIDLNFTNLLQAYQIQNQIPNPKIRKTETGDEKKKSRRCSFQPPRVRTSVQLHRRRIALGPHLHSQPVSSAPVDTNPVSQAAAAPVAASFPVVVPVP
ncbi:hypothetical protein M0R45_035656 [Rubus argutus]|uniref:Uncharacterized protein n=1 Tax=Rubus argutus TaxID=59490 RepID=A0AAW1VVI8_RUBAR